MIIGLDGTEARGTGRLASDIAAALTTEYPLVGVTRHQLLTGPRVRWGE